MSERQRYVACECGRQVEIEDIVTDAYFRGSRCAWRDAYKAAVKIIKALFPWLIDADGHPYDPGAEPFVTAARAYVELAEQVIADEEGGNG